MSSADSERSFGQTSLHLLVKNISSYHITFYPLLHQTLHQLPLLFAGHMPMAPAHHGNSLQDLIQIAHIPFKLEGPGMDAACQDNLTSAGQRWMRAFLSPLAILLLKQPSAQFAVTVLHWVILHLMSTVTPKSLSLSHLSATTLLLSLFWVINSMCTCPLSLLHQGLCQFEMRALCNLQEAVSHYNFAPHSVQWGAISLLILILTHKIERFYFLFLFNIHIK